MHHGTSGLPVHHQLPKFTQTHVHWVGAVMPSNHLILCHPLLILPSIFSSIRILSSESVLHIRYEMWSIRVSASASVLPMNIQDWLPLGLNGLISFQSKGLSKFFSSSTIQNHQSSVLSLLYGPALTSVHDYRKNCSLTIQMFVGKVMSLLFNMLSRFIIAFLPRAKSVNFRTAVTIAVILEPKKIKSVIVSIFSHLFAMNW